MATCRALTRTSRWRTLTSEEEDENEFRQNEIRTDRHWKVLSISTPFRGPGWMLELIRSSYKGRTVDALALEADEGRGYLR
jgi:hypothetical protein